MDLDEGYGYLDIEGRRRVGSSRGVGSVWWGFRYLPIAGWKSMVGNRALSMGDCGWDMVVFLQARGG